METVVVTLTGNDTACQIAAAGQILKQGGLVAFPTETVYGLGADALNPQASRRIYEAIRKIVPLFIEDAPFYKQIAAVETYLKNNPLKLK